MDANQLKDLLKENKVAVALSLVAVAALAAWHFRADSLAVAESQLKTAESGLNLLKANELHSKTLDADLLELKSEYSKLVSSNLDFEDGLSTQGFFTDLLASSGLKYDGVPALVAAPVSIGSTKFLKGSYVLRVEGPAPSVFAFAKKCEEGTQRYLHVERLQIAQATDKSALSADIAVSAWGRRGALAPLVPENKPGAITTSQIRTQKIKEYKSLSSVTISTPTVHILGGAAAASAGAPASSLDSVVNSLKVTYTLFSGKPAVRIDKVGLRREGNTFEILVDGVSTKVTILSVTAESVSMSVSGRVFKIPFSK